MAKVNRSQYSESFSESVFDNHLHGLPDIPDSPHASVDVGWQIKVNRMREIHSD
jgi:hypothetical protein